MKIVFVSNYFNHHQSFLSDAFWRETGGEYAFIETTPFNAERKKLGWGIEECPEYVFCSYESEDEYTKCEKLVSEADVVITALPGHGLMKKRYEQKKLTFQYSERLFKTGFKPHLLVGRFLKYQKVVGGKKNMYLLAASGYAECDYRKIGLYKNKAYRWAYFPEVKTYDVDALMEGKRADEKLNILWAGRFIDWKHPELPIRTAKCLAENGVDFHLTMIGNGDMLEDMKKLAADIGVSEKVTFTGGIKPEQVREQMERANIYLFTSDQNEGWGAVLNEAMNSGCAVVTDRNIGAAPFLLKDGENGLIYKNEEELFDKAMMLAANSDIREVLGRAAYGTMKNIWNADVAAKRFLTLAKEISERGESCAFSDGPCSKI